MAVQSRAPESPGYTFQFTPEPKAPERPGKAEQYFARDMKRYAMARDAEGTRADNASHVEARGLFPYTLYQNFFHLRKDGPISPQEYMRLEAAAREAYGKQNLSAYTEILKAALLRSNVALGLMKNGYKVELPDPVKKANSKIEKMPEAHVRITFPPMYTDGRSAYQNYVRELSISIHPQVPVRKFPNWSLLYMDKPGDFSSTGSLAAEVLQDKNLLLTDPIKQQEAADCLDRQMRSNDPTDTRIDHQAEAYQMIYADQRNQILNDLSISQRELVDECAERERVCGYGPGQVRAAHLLLPWTDRNHYPEMLDWATGQATPISNKNTGEEVDPVERMVLVNMRNGGILPETYIHQWDDIYMPEDPNFPQLALAV